MSKKIVTDYVRSEKFTTMGELQKWIALSFRNFLYYANSKLVFKTGKIQLEIADRLTEGYDTVMLMAFRGAGKTYIIDLYILFRLHRYINTKILVLSAKEENAAKHVRNISKMIKALPALHYMTFSKKTESGFQLANASVENDLSVQTAGIFSAVEGSRSDVIIIDDAEVQSNSESDLLREKLLSRYSEVQAILHPAGRHCVEGINNTPEQTSGIWIGTPQCEQSTYFNAELLDSEGEVEPHPLAGSHLIRIPAITPEGLPAFPERFNRQQLDIKKKRMSTPRWALQMMLDPTLVDQEARVIDMRHILHYDGPITDICCAIDPAGEEGGGKGDEHALCIGGLRENSKDIPGSDKQIVHIKKLIGDNKLNISQFFEKAIDLCKQQKVETIIIESNFSGYYTLLKQMVANEGSFAMVLPVKSTMRKQTRLVEVLDPAINGGRVSFDESIFKDPKNTAQIKNWTYKSLPEKDDRIDALALLIAHMQQSMEAPDSFKWDVSSVDSFNPWQ